MSVLERVLSNLKQQQIAHGCSLTVVTEPEYAAAGRDIIPGCLEPIFPEQWRRRKAKTRYDLISVPDLNGLAEDGVRFGLLVEDLRTAISLHQAEHVAIISDALNTAKLAERLARQPELRNVTIRCYWSLKRPQPVNCLVLTCMDWRLHGAGGLLKGVNGLGGPNGGLNVMTIPGAVKQLNAGEVHGRVLLQLLSDLADKGLAKLVLVAHTDCGKYGGCEAFAGQIDEDAKLTADLRQAAEFIQTHFDLEIELAIARLKGQKVECVCSVPRKNPFSVRICYDDDL